MLYAFPLIWDIETHKLTWKCITLKVFITKSLSSNIKHLTLFSSFCFLMVVKKIASKGATSFPLLTMVSCYWCFHQTSCYWPRTAKFAYLILCLKLHFPFLENVCCLVQASSLHLDDLFHLHNLVKMLDCQRNWSLKPCMTVVVLSYWC